MSRHPYGSNLYPNGDHAPNNAAAYNTSYRDGGSLRMEGEHRAGGYGGFHADNNEHPNPLTNGRGLQGPSDNHHRFANNGYGHPPHRAGDRSQADRPLESRAIERGGTQNNSSLYGTGPGGRQIQGTRSAKLKEILKSWDAKLFAKLQAVPEQLDARIADKQFLTAVELLQDALRMIRRSEMESIGALADLRVYFSNQETSLTDILVEELHDHLYLKSPQCQDRWKSYYSASQDSPEQPKSALGAYQLNDAVPAERQKDSFCYIHMLLEALDRLGCLDVAVDRIEQRLPVELFTIVERTNQEVDLHHPMHLRDGGRLESILDVHVRDDKERSAVLEDLLWTLYSKFEAIAEGHRVVHDVVVGIARRNGVRHPDRLGGSFKELWKLYQSELRSLLHDYIATDENNPTRFGRSQPVESNPLQSNRRDRAKVLASESRECFTILMAPQKIFQMVEVDQKSGDLTAEQEELDRILQNSVPGLATKPQRRSGIQRAKDRVSKGGPATHKLLVESSVFNIGILLPPSLTFLQRLKDIVPPNSDIAISTLTTFLDDFLVNVFLPQLEESVTELCAQSHIGRDAFQEDPQWRQWAPRPILKVLLTEELKRTAKLNHTEHSFILDLDQDLLQIA
ncbi:hypothetical protein Q9189_000264 [Teloschistes chrysophthalmus]